MNEKTKTEVKQRICQLIERGHTDKNNIIIILSDEFKTSRYRIVKIMEEHKNKLQEKHDILNEDVVVE